MLARMTFALLASFALAPVAEAAAPPYVRLDAHGDPLPPGAVARLGTVRLRHVWPIGEVGYLDGGKTLFSSGRQVRFWSADGRPLGRMAPSDADVVTRGFAISPDGKVLAKGEGRWGTESYHAVVLWDVATRKRLRTLSLEGASGLAFSPDGKRLAVGVKANVHVYDVASGKLVRELVPEERDRQRVALVAFLQAGKQTLSVTRWERKVGDKDDEERRRRKSEHFAECYVHDLATGKVVRQWRVAAEKDKQIRRAALSPDGKSLAVATEETVRLHDVGTGREVWRVAGECNDSLAFSPDGKRLAVGAFNRKDVGGSLSVLDASNGKRLVHREGRDVRLYCLAFSPDGKEIAGGNDYRLITFAAATLKARGEVTTQNRFLPKRFMADGKTVLGEEGPYGVLGRWDVFTGKLHRGREVWGQLRDFHPRFLVAANYWSEIRLYDVEAAEVLHKWDLKEEWLQGLALSPDGKYLASGGGNQYLRLMDVKSGKELWRRSLPAQAGDLGDLSDPGWRAPLGFADGGKALVSLETDGTLRLHDVRSGKELRRAAVGSYYGILSADGRWLVTGPYKNAELARLVGPKTVQLWDLEGPWPPRSVTLEPSASFPGGREGRSAAFSPDGRLLASAMRDGHEARVYEVASGREVMRLRGHESKIEGLVFSPDGRLLASGGGDDGTALLWDVTGRAPDGRLLPWTPKAEQLETLWGDLAGRDAAAANRAVWALIAAGRPAVALLAKRCRPVPEVPAKRLQSLVAGLDADGFDDRQDAEQRLAKLGRLAAPALVEALADKPSLEVRVRAARLLEPLRLPTTVDPDELRGLRAVWALEQIGGDEAKAALKRLAGGAEGARLTSEAKAALRRLDAR